MQFDGDLGSRVVSRLPGAAAALWAGVLSEEQLGVVRRTLRELPDDVASSTRIQVEQQLVGEAQRFDPSQLAMRIRAHLDPDGVLRAEGTPRTGWSCRSPRTSAA